MTTQLDRQPIVGARHPGPADPTIRAFSCGAGVQSTTIALLMRDGRLPLVDHVVFADTGWEPARVYAQVEPINRKVRELLGARPPRFHRAPKGRLAEQWIGFSTDEIGRVSDKNSVSYLRSRCPLLELGMSRRDCVRYLDRSGWGDTTKSSCIGCPYHGNRQWRALRDNHPGEWVDAVEFDRQIRKGGARGLPLNGEAFLHSSRVPLDIAPIDHWTRGDRAAANAEVQGDLFDLIEDGDPDSCSPYGCRSGAAS